MRSGNSVGEVVLTVIGWRVNNLDSWGGKANNLIELQHDSAGLL